MGEVALSGTVVAVPDLEERRGRPSWPEAKQISGRVRMGVLAHAASALPEQVLETGERFAFTPHTEPADLEISPAWSPGTAQATHLPPFPSIT